MELTMVNKDFTHLGLFEGIGGFSLAARWMGWETLAWCEWNEFGQKVLRHHFPEAEGFGDITKTDFRKYANTIDILTGGFPCQPYSVAGKRKGKEDERHLWPEMLRAIREIQPTYVVGENVGGLVNWNGGMVFNEVQADLEAEGYEVQPFILPACAKNAPHRRDRVWFIAYSKSWRQRGLRNEIETTRTRENDKPFRSICGICNDANTERTGPQEQYLASEPNKQRYSSRLSITEWANFPTQSPIRSGNDGLPSKLDGITFSKWRNESIKAYGNAIVPQVAFEIFKAIEKLRFILTSE